MSLPSFGDGVAYVQYPLSEYEASGGSRRLQAHLRPHSEPDPSGHGNDTILFS
jgi:hypothetical protein